jgi:hypothetical protein
MPGRNSAATQDRRAGWAQRLRGGHPGGNAGRCAGRPHVGDRFARPRPLRRATWPSTDCAEPSVPAGRKESGIWTTRTSEGRRMLPAAISRPATTPPSQWPSAASGCMARSPAASRSTAASSRRISKPGRPRTRGQRPVSQEESAGTPIAFPTFRSSEGGCALTSHDVRDLQATGGSAETPSCE